jgi:hypothetical protein
MSAPRRFQPPWRVDDAGDGEVLRVVDAGGQILAYGSMKMSRFAAIL